MKIRHKEEATKEVLNGINEAANAIKVTLGYKGRNVLIRDVRSAEWKITKDGVTVSKSISLDTPQQDTGARIVCAACEATVNEAGDGTTATAVLVQALVNEGNKAVLDGANPILLKRGIDDMSQKVVEYIKEKTKKIDLSEQSKDIDNIALISANSDTEIGGIVAKAMKQVGEFGAVDVEASPDGSTIFEKAIGSIYAGKLASPYFITDKVKKRVVLNKCYVLIYDRKIAEFAPLVNYLNYIASQKGNLLLVCDQAQEEVLATLIQNHLNGVFKSCIVDSTFFGLQRRLAFEDLQKSVGGIFISEEKNMEIRCVPDEVSERLGFAEKIVIEEDRAVIINGKGNPTEIAEHLNTIKEEVANETDAKMIQFHKQRIARISGNVATLKIGGNNPQEAEEKKERIDDAICAVRAALKEGVVCGGGALFLKASNTLDFIPNNTDYDKGRKIVLEAIKAPFRQLLTNAKIEDRYDEISKQIIATDETIGFNLRNEKVESYIESGVIDPSKVLRVALESAKSAAGLYLTTECSIMPH